MRDWFKQDRRVSGLTGRLPSMWRLSTATSWHIDAVQQGPSTPSTPASSLRSCSGYGVSLSWPYISFGEAPMRSSYHRVGLRHLGEADAARVAAWMSRKRLPETISVLNREHYRRRVTWRALSQPHRTRHIFMIMHGSTPIGLSAIYNLNENDRSAFTGTIIFNQKYQGQGYGYASKILQNKFAFETLNLDVTYARVPTSNTKLQEGLKTFGYAEVPEPRTAEETVFALTRTAWKSWAEHHTS
jgi:RimJ/RimL family protein N-acetyltransferase